MHWRLAWKFLVDAIVRRSGSPSRHRVPGLIARADSLRDQGKWKLAAQAYLDVLELAPGLPHIWVQVGNMSKEAGDLEQSEAAYLKGIALNHHLADAHLQLGRLLAIKGNPSSAVASYINVLDIDRHSTAAVTELIALGRGSEVGQRTDVGFHLLGGISATLAELRKSLDRVESALPGILSLCSVPADDFSLFSRRFCLPTPPAHSKTVRWSAVVIDTGSQEVIKTARSLSEHFDKWARVTVLSQDTELQSKLQQLSNAGLACSLNVLRHAASEHSRSDEWIIVAEAGTELVPHALPWFDWAVSQVDVVALYSDEELVVFDELSGEETCRGYFKSSYDSESTDSLHIHALLAIRGDVYDQYVESLGENSLTLCELERFAAAIGRIGHLPRVLSRRGPIARKPSKPNSVAVHTSEELRIGVIVPTRDGGKALEDCVASLQLRAAAGEGFEIVIVDNGSVENATLEFLEEVSRRHRVSVVRDPRPFNWPQLSNLGARACNSEILLFLNDDVELLSNNWDMLLRSNLARPNVGVLGCKLFYPDGELQHAGIVLGPDGRTAHEGRGKVTPEIRHRWNTRRKVGAVTGAFLACRREVFELIEGFDESHFSIWFNDVDFCLHARMQGLVILYEPAIFGLHHESKTLKRMPESPHLRNLWKEALSTMEVRWGAAFTSDPGFNPHFSRSGYPFENVLEPSQQSIASHLAISAQSNPWLIPNVN